MRAILPTSGSNSPVPRVGDPDADTEKIKAWSREIAAAAERIPAEEHERFLAALDEVKKESKEQVRRAWGLA